MQTTRILTTLLATGAATLAVGAAAAQADSIAYVKGGDVWLTTTDGARQFQVTAGGGYQHVSQADDGSLLATKGGDLVHLDHFGTVLSDIRTPVSTTTSTLFQFYGPFDADISPSGKTTAYGWWQKGYFTHGSVLDYEEHNGHGFTRTDALTGFTDDGYKYAKSWDAPEFIDDSTVLVSNGPGWPSDPFAVETIGSGDPQGWFTDPDNMHPLEATISRNKRVIAAVVGPDRQGIAVYRDWDGQVKGTVSKCFTYGSDGHDGAPSMESPTLNATGSLFAYSDGHDLMVAPIGDMTSTCPSGVTARDIVSGATSPDWGPADVPTTRPASTQNGGLSGAATGGSSGGQGGSTSTVQNGSTQAPNGGSPNGGQSAQNGGQSQGTEIVAPISITVPKGRVSSVLSRGVKLTVAAPTGKVTVTAQAGSTVVGRVTAKVGKSGRATLTLKLNAVGARKYRAKRRLVITLSAVQGAQSATAKLSL